MNGPVHSRGIGRSGPKRKTGCLTCRRRKVRCDEARPVCANCVRLRLECEYVAPKTSTGQHVSPTSSAAALSTASQRTLSVTSQMSFEDAESEPTTKSTAQNIPLLPGTSLAEQVHHWNIANELAPAFVLPFQDTFRTSESFESFGVAVGLPSSSDSLFGPEYFSSEPSGVAFRSQTIDYDLQRPCMDGEEARSVLDEARRKLLVQHFIEFVNPVSVIQPTHTEWSSARRNVLGAANECAHLMSAVCSLSALHLYTTFGEDCFEEALRHYRSSSKSINRVLEEVDVDERALKQAFASAFLLTCVELMAQTTAKGKRNAWPLHYLQTAQHRVRQYGSRIRLWTGTSKRLIIWMTLLQTKAEWNSGSPALQLSSATLSQSIGDPFVRDPLAIFFGENWNNLYNSKMRGDSSMTFAESDEEDDMRSTSELVYDTINQPGFDFFLRCQTFMSRIIGIDEYHRDRNVLETDLETLKDGQRINAELHTLWAARPATINFLNDPKGLESVIQPELAQQILLNLQVYLATFFAQFIYLHRVAFKAFPATYDVKMAVGRIIGLVKDILRSFRERRGSVAESASSTSTRTGLSGTAEAVESNQNTTASDREISLPPTMLWPIFLAATECGLPERSWLLQAMREVDKRSCPNAARTIFLLEEVLKRQDQEGQRVDHRSVRKDVFEGDLSVLY